MIVGNLDLREDGARLLFYRFRYSLSRKNAYQRGATLAVNRFLDAPQSWVGSQHEPKQNAPDRTKIYERTPRVIDD